MTNKNTEDILDLSEINDSDSLFEIDNTLTNKEEKKEDNPLNKSSSNDINKIKDELLIDNSEIILDKERKEEDINENLEENKEKDIIIEEEKIDNDIDTSIDEWFMDEINDLKEEVDTKKEKKSFFSSLFKKKEKKKEEDTNKNQTDDNLDDAWSNIFDEFTQDDSLLQEVDQIKEERNRDVFYYLVNTTKIFKILFILSLIWLSMVYGYIYVQNKLYEWNSVDNQLLWPFCYILLGDIKHDSLTFCTSITTLNDIYKKDLENIKNSQKNSIVSVVKKVYEIENFTKTKDVLFLSDKTDNKLKILEILEEFDNLKNEFAKVDKQIIQCSSFEINSEDKILSMKCNAYSAWFETWIRWFDWKNDNNSALKWTSITIANSFINFVNLESKTFRVINRQKLFKAENIVWSETGFTSKTPFTLKLKYNLD